ncbi:MAG: dipeptide/oligopeptide/nickel ABC transporter ATP-binding protein [Candidatus Tectimicrobiota bacterium]|nr:MAG: dipeptide/oligopeptide/nickel ABC transporter ATP-binding protein [Candidatus Tectomicrobia bacterium]
MSQAPLLEVRDLHTYLFPRRGVIRAVDGVSFTLHRGETLGLVGESGCGKTMTALSLLRLVPQPVARIVKGEIWLEGEDLLQKSEREMRRIRGRKIAMILQDPQTSLNPVLTVGTQLIEALALQGREASSRLVARAVELLQRVRVADAARRLRHYPHQLSGGMKQRVVGAIAMAGNPQVLIADEPTTALDVTIQLQYLNLLKELQAQTAMALLFITHDFGVVAHTCDRVAVMYAGRIVESGPVRAVFNRPAHPYTQALIAAVPSLDEPVERLDTIEGQPPAPEAFPAGCRFHPRCPYAEPRCHQDYPPTLPVADGHTAACWRLAAP